MKNTAKLSAWKLHQFISTKVIPLSLQILSIIKFLHFCQSERENSFVWICFFVIICPFEQPFMCLLGICVSSYHWLHSCPLLFHLVSHLFLLSSKSYLSLSGGLFTFRFLTFDFTGFFFGLCKGKTHSSSCVSSLLSHYFRLHFWHQRWGFPHIRHFSDTSWVSLNLPHFCHCLPGDSVRSHRLRAESYKTDPISSPVLCCWLAINWRVPLPPWFD